MFVKKIILFFTIYINLTVVFSNYSFYEITAFNSRERHLLYKLQETHENIVFLNGVTNEAATPIDVVVKDCFIDEFEAILYKYDIQYFCVAQNIQFSTSNKINKTNTYSLPNFDISETFPDWDDILLWVDKKIKDNSELTKIVIAKTYEQRDIFILKISTAKSSNNMAVFIVAGEEGRDWLSTVVLLNYISKVLKTASSPDSLLNNFDLYLMPIFNPDGFVYSKQKDRFWAKNRKEIRPAKVCSNNSVALGVNIDRNWFLTKSGSNEAACNAIFVGYKSLSEEETQAFSYILDRIALKLLAFMNIRGFQNLIALPYSHGNEVSINHNIVNEIMKHASSILKEKYYATYPVGTTANYFYNFSGNMADWVKKKLNIPIVFTLYMQYDDFFPQPSHIVPLSNQLDTLLNVTLSISKDIYGSLYNAGNKRTYETILIISQIFLLVQNIIYKIIQFNHDFLT